MHSFDWLHTLVSICVIVATVVLGTVVITAVRDNTQLSKNQNDLDMKAYQTCIEQQKWTPTECRVGIYGVK